MTSMVTTGMPVIEEAARKRRPWLAPFRFTGRIGRKRYWAATLGTLLGGILGVAIWLVLAIVNYNPPQEVTIRVTIGFVLLGISGVALIVAIVAGLVSTGIRRLHDRGKSGWWLVLYYAAPERLLTSGAALWHRWDDGLVVIPLLGLAVLAGGLVDLGFMAGDPAGNAYGPPPGADKLDVSPQPR
jgi:uncharacterized membrane protein YhaH (DUF805 family)